MKLDDQWLVVRNPGRGGPGIRYIDLRAIYPVEPVPGAFRAP